MRAPRPLSGPITPVQAVELRNNLTNYILIEHEKLYESFTLGMKVQEHLGLKRPPTEILNRDRYSEFLNLIAQDLRESEIVLWPLDLFDAAARGCTCFEGQPADSSIWRRRSQFWLFNWDVIKNKGIFISDHLKKVMNQEECQEYRPLGMIVAPDPPNRCVYLTALMITDFSEYAIQQKTSVDDLHVSPLWIDTGKRITEGVECPSMSDASITMALTRFLDLKLTAQDPHQWSKTEGKQLARQKLAMSMVRVVRLRRSEQRESDQSRNVDWSCKWVVDGHWRMQWFPSEGVHKPVYIDSYVKGPEDKPLKARPETVFSVVK